MEAGRLDAADAKQALRDRVLARRDAIDPCERDRRSALVCAKLSTALDRALEQARDRAGGRTCGLTNDRAGSGSHPGKPVVDGGSDAHAQNAGTPLFVVSVYAAMKSEVNLDAFVAHAFEQGCSVAYPCMVKNPDWTLERAEQAACDGSFLPRTLMEFRIATSPDQAKKAPFVRRPLRSHEPESPDLDPWPTVEPAQIDFAVCPLVAFEDSGGRIGYGGGNYDRLLSEIGPNAIVVGVAFEEQRVPEGAIPKEPHDRSLPAVVSG